MKPTVTRPPNLPVARAGTSSLAGEVSPVGQEEPRSLRDEAYEAIKHRIITCAFKPGEYINEAQVSDLLEIGRTPVHQALDRLMHEGMVEVLPRKGVVVRPVSLDEVLQITEVRLLTETYCARLAAERADNGEIEAMAQILSRAREATQNRDVEQMMICDRDFHMAMARSAKNMVLAEVLRNLHERSLRFWFISLTAPDHHVHVQDQHGEILKAIRSRDGDTCEKAMRRHIDSFRKNVMRYL